MIDLDGGPASRGGGGHVKAIRSRALDWQKVLLTKDCAAFVAELRRRANDDDHAADILVELIVDVDAWRKAETPSAAARALVAMGQSARERVLDVLDEVLVEDGAPHPAWLSLVEVLANFGERGVRDDRAWSWLERVRMADEALWCAFVSGYGDERAVPTLRAIVERFERTELLARSAYDDDQQLVIEAVGALQELGGNRPVDDDMAEQIRAAIQSRPQKKPSR